MADRALVPTLAPAAAIAACGSGTGDSRTVTSSPVGPSDTNLSTSYTAPWNAANPNIIVGSLIGDSLRDFRASRLYISPFPRPAALGSGIAHE